MLDMANSHGSFTHSFKRVQDQVVEREWWPDQLVLSEGAPPSQRAPCHPVSSCQVCSVAGVEWYVDRGRGGREVTWLC